MFTHEDHHHHHLHQHHHLFQFPAPNRPILMDRRWKQPNIDLAPNCPRCDSSNTKFCYYNNYSLTQPRYFCKGCRRYWTKGGSLRNVPVGGGCRKNRRGKSVRISSSNNRNSSPPPGASGYGGSNSAPVSRDDISPIGDNITTPRSDSSSSTIDLALVYAKFLNPHQQPAVDSSNDHPRVSMPEMPPSTDRIFGSSSSFEYSSSTISEPSILEPHVNPIHHRFASSSSLSQDHQQCIINRLSSSNPSPSEIEGSTQQQQQQVLLGEVVDLNSYKLQESRLIIPPQFTSLEPNSTSYLLPSTEEVVLDQDHLWLNSPILGSNSTYPWHQTTEEEPFEPMVVDHNHSTFRSNPMDSNWSSFDLPSYEAFPRQ